MSHGRALEFLESCLPAISAAVKPHFQVSHDHDCEGPPLPNLIIPSSPPSKRPSLGTRDSVLPMSSLSNVIVLPSTPMPAVGSNFSSPAVALGHGPCGGSYTPIVGLTPSDPAVGPSRPIKIRRPPPLVPGNMGPSSVPAVPVISDGALTQSNQPQPALPSSPLLPAEGMAPPLALGGLQSLPSDAVLDSVSKPPLPYPWWVPGCPPRGRSRLHLSIIAQMDGLMPSLLGLRAEHDVFAPDALSAYSSNWGFNLWRSWSTFVGIFYPAFHELYTMVAAAASNQCCGLFIVPIWPDEGRKVSFASEEPTTWYRLLKRHALLTFTIESLSSRVLALLNLPLLSSMISIALLPRSTGMAS